MAQAPLTPTVIDDQNVDREWMNEFILGHQVATGVGITTAAGQLTYGTGERELAVLDPPDSPSVLFIDGTIPEWVDRGTISGGLIDSGIWRGQAGFAVTEAGRLFLTATGGFVRVSAQSHTGVNSVTFQSAAWLSQVSVGDYILGTNLTGQPGVIIHARVNTLGVVYDSVDDNYTIHADVLYFSPELDFDLTDQYWTISAYYRSAVAAGDVIGLAQGDAGALDSDTRLVTVDGDTLEQTTIGELDLVSRPSHLGDVTEFPGFTQGVTGSSLSPKEWQRISSVDWNGFEIRPSPTEFRDFDSEFQVGALAEYVQGGTLYTGVISGVSSSFGTWDITLDSTTVMNPAANYSSGTGSWRAYKRYPEFRNFRQLVDDANPGRTDVASELALVNYVGQNIASAANWWGDTDVTISGAMTGGSLLYRDVTISGAVTITNTPTMIVCRNLTFNASSSITTLVTTGTTPVAPFNFRTYDGLGGGAGAAASGSGTNQVFSAGDGADANLPAGLLCGAGAGGGGGGGGGPVGNDGASGDASAVTDLPHWPYALLQSTLTGGNIDIAGLGGSLGGVGGNGSDSSSATNEFSGGVGSTTVGAAGGVLLIRADTIDLGGNTTTFIASGGGGAAGTRGQNVGSGSGAGGGSGGASGGSGGGLVAIAYNVGGGLSVSDINVTGGSGGAMTLGGSGDSPFRDGGIGASAEDGTDGTIILMPNANF